METSSTREKEAVIVGAGLVGALWAVFLAQRGYAVKVFERRPDMRAAGYQGGRSINLAMSVRGWKAIEQAGLREKIEQVAIPMPGRMMHGLAGELTFCSKILIGSLRTPPTITVGQSHLSPFTRLPL